MRLFFCVLALATCLRYSRALACYRLAKALFVALGARSNEAQSLIDQAKTCQAIGDRATALTHYEQALEMMEAGAVLFSLARFLFRSASSFPFLYFKMRLTKRVPMTTSEKAHCSSRATTTAHKLARIEKSLNCASFGKLVQIICRVPQRARLRSAGVR
jgi:tetratricopeptide (TPR) repeat protein